MEIKRIGKVLLLSSIISAIILMTINECARVFVADIVSAIIVALIVVLLTLVLTVIVLNISFVNKWLNR